MQDVREAKVISRRQVNPKLAPKALQAEYELKLMLEYISELKRQD